MLSTLEQLRTAPPTQAEVDRAKAVLIARARASNDDVASSIARWLTALELGDDVSIANQVASIDRVSAVEVKALAEKALQLDSLQMVFSGDALKIEGAIRANHLGKVATLNAAHE